MLIACSLFAFGGVYAWAAVPLIAASMLFGVLCRPRLDAAGPLGSLDTWLLLLLAIVAVQVAPLPVWLLSLLSPAALSFREAFHLRSRDPDGDLGFVTSSLAPVDSLYSLALLGSVFLVFWGCRHAFTGRDSRDAARLIAWTGLGAALLAIAQQATSRPPLVYWGWEPVARIAQPFGPFVNRNHFATWMVMAVPLTIGYILTRAHRGRSDREGTRARSWNRAIDLRMTWLIVAGTLMTLSVFLSASRSGILSLAVALTVVGGLHAGRVSRRARGWLLGYFILLAMVLVAWVDVEALVSRLDDTLSTAGPGRLIIWRETLPVVRDFWLIGTGVGTYETAMLLYQQSFRSIRFFNQAHSHYLQLAAEGGFLLVMPTVLALIALVRLVLRRLNEDQSAVYWIRVGAVTALVGVAVQSIWETGLRMPANAILAAVVAAIAVHRPERSAPVASTRS